MADMVEWCSWTPPASEVASAIQFPLDERWTGRVINAYIKDARRARTALPASPVHPQGS